MNKLPMPFWKNRFFSKLYYELKPIIPRRLQLHARKFFYRKILKECASIWPIDPTAEKKPIGWTGWPDGKQFALVLTHDVESEAGLSQCRRLAELEMEMGFRSSFQFLLNKYDTPDDLRQYLTDNGFEVAIHGCHHDGKMFRSQKIFRERASIINRYLEQWNVTGFRSPSMHSRLDWIGELDVQYDMSTFDVDPFEPQGQGVGTIFPFMVPRKNGGPDYVEIPYTLPQDFTLFVILGEESTAIWKRKLAWIALHGGMAVLVVHPDYLSFNGEPVGMGKYDARLYREFLGFVKDEYGGKFWPALPGDLATFFRMTQSGGTSSAG